MLSHLRLQQDQLVLDTLSDKYIAVLTELASDPAIWHCNHPAINHPDQFTTIWLPAALEQQAAQTRFPLVIFMGDQMVGSTSYYEYHPKHQRIAIGYTWLHPRYWGSGLNQTIKQLMLAYAFNTLGCQRVGFYIDSANQRSCRAVEKLGAVKEGILRRHLRRPDHTFRDTVCYSILAAEWQQHDS